jgi:stalled ribosome alternative rescue factor ArfA
MAVTSKAKGRVKPKKRAGRKMKPKKTVKRRSAAAAALASPLYRKRVVRSAKAYSRKRSGRMPDEEGEQA